MIWCRGTAHIVRRVSTSCAGGEHQWCGRLRCTDLLSIRKLVYYELGLKESRGLRRKNLW